MTRPLSVNTFEKTLLLRHSSPCVETFDDRVLRRSSYLDLMQWHTQSTSTSGGAFFGRSFVTASLILSPMHTAYDAEFKATFQPQS
jgi:hypothetical protein